MSMDKVIIKSYPNGLSLYLDKNVSFKEILLEIGVQFQKNASFFKNATLVLSIDGRDLSIEEEKDIIRAIEGNSNISICSIAGKEMEKSQQFDDRVNSIKNILEITRTKKKEEKIIWGSVLSNKSIESDMTVIVIGNIEKDASVISEKNIIVLGSILGEARAGIKNTDSSFIFATSMDPQRITLAKEELILDKKMRKLMKKEAKLVYFDEDIKVSSVKADLFEDVEC